MWQLCESDFPALDFVNVVWKWEDVLNGCLWDHKIPPLHKASIVLGCISSLLQFFLSLFCRRVACTTTWQLKIEDAPEIICDACWISATAVWYSTNRILIFMQHNCVKDQSSRLLGIRREKLQPRIRVVIHLFWKAVTDQMFRRERDPMVHGHSKAVKIRPREFKIIFFLGSC